MRARHWGSATRGRGRTPLPSSLGGIGTLLRVTREELGTSLLTVNAATGVTLGCLEALETGRVLGYGDQLTILTGLRRYASYLGLDGDALALALLDAWPGALATAPPRAEPTGAPSHVGDGHGARPPAGGSATWAAAPGRWDGTPGAAPSGWAAADGAGPVASEPGGSSWPWAPPGTGESPESWAASDTPTGVHSILTMTTQVPAVVGPRIGAGTGASPGGLRSGAPPVYRRRRRVPLALRMAMWLAVVLLAVGGAGLAVDHWRPQWLQELHIVRASRTPATARRARAAPVSRQFHETSATATGADFAVPALHFSIEVGITQLTWVQVTTSRSSSPLFTGELGPGAEIQTFRATGDLTVEIGAGGTLVAVMVNGKAVGVLKPPTAPYTLVFTSAPGH